MPNNNTERLILARLVYEFSESDNISPSDVIKYLLDIGTVPDRCHFRSSEEAEYSGQIQVWENRPENDEELAARLKAQELQANVAKQTKNIQAQKRKEQDRREYERLKKKFEKEKKKT